MAKTLDLISVLITIFAALHCTAGFTSPSRSGNRIQNGKPLMAQQAPPPAFNLQTPSSVSSLTPMTTSSPILGDAVGKWVITNDNENSINSAPTFTLSLQERHIPTPEEIAAKKRNFNLLFWGGGFVAPFLATFFYFGFRFWEK